MGDYPGGVLAILAALGIGAVGHAPPVQVAAPPPKQ